MIQRSSPRLVIVAALALALFAPVAASAATVVVTNARDEGPGSFRDAIRRANLSPNVSTIQFLFTVRTVLLESTVEYTGLQALTIYGNGATLDGSAISTDGVLGEDELLRGVGAAFRVVGGADLAVSSLTVRRAPGEGIAVVVPAARTGVVRVWLFNVEASANSGHGVLVNDEEDPRTFEDAAGNAIQPDPDGSPASVAVTVLSSRFVANGFGVVDRDGLRVNEGGDGDLTLTTRLTAAKDNGADGIELDERGSGSVYVDVFAAQLTGNGSLTEADYDDGFDIDEYNDGGIFGQVVLATVSGNWEEGLDFNENNLGDLRVDLLLVEANGNREEAIDYEEDDDFAGGGDLVTTMAGIRANDNGADGGDGAVKIREKGDGRLQATLRGLETLDNRYDGVNLREDSTGDLRVSVEQLNARRNAGDGLSLDERSGGTLTAAVANSTMVLNDAAVSVPPDVDLKADGTGTLVLTGVTYNTSAVAPGIAVTTNP